MMNLKLHMKLNYQTKAVSNVHIFEVTKQRIYSTISHRIVVCAEDKMLNENHLVRNRTQPYPSLHLTCSTAKCQTLT